MDVPTFVQIAFTAVATVATAVSWTSRKIATLEAKVAGNKELIETELKHLNKTLAEIRADQQYFIDYVLRKNGDNQWYQSSQR